jgi:hypothetical protein
MWALDSSSIYMCQLGYQQVHIGVLSALTDLFGVNPAK